MIRTFYLLSFLVLIAWNPKPSQLRNGSWKAILYRNDHLEIPFNFIIDNKQGKKVLYVKNAGEELLVDEVKVINDSVWINLPFFESSIKAKLDAKGNLTGSWFKRLSDHDQVMP